MSANIILLNPNQPKKVLLIVSNPAVSPTTGWPIGAWVAEFVHPYWEFTEKGHQVEIITPHGGKSSWTALATHATPAATRRTICSALAS